MDGPVVRADRVVEVWLNEKLFFSEHCLVSEAAVSFSWQRGRGGSGHRRTHRTSSEINAAVR